LIALVGELHYRDAVARGESVVPVAVGSGLSIAVIAAVFLAGARWGPEHAAGRSARLIRRLTPIVIGIAALRVIAMLFGH
jgi:hypothetical protein